MISIEAALEIILSDIRPLGAESLPLLSALDRVLTEDIVASRPNPPWDNSAMDGYAVKEKDTLGASKNAPVTLKVIADIPAGSVCRKILGRGEAIRIMTGATCPKGADAVVMVEYYERSGESGVKILREAKAGDNIRRVGEDYSIGDILIKAGHLIRPAEIAILASAGVAYVNVYQRPRVAVLSTGDELVDIHEGLAEGKIVNSNSYALSAQIISCGGQPVQLGIARDTKENLEAKLRDGLNTDCIVSSGGVSAGDYDFVKEVLKDLGSEMHFWKVAMKPGKPLAYGLINNIPAFGLPGNPISSMVAFDQFVAPALRKMAGRMAIFKVAVEALLRRDFKKKAGRVNFIRAILEGKGGDYSVIPLEGQGSGMISSMVKANSLIVLPTDGTAFIKGEKVKVIPIDDSLFYHNITPY